jgi:hypothetical protein
VSVNLTYIIFDVEIVHEGFATSDFYVLGKLQQTAKAQKRLISSYLKRVQAAPHAIQVDPRESMCKEVTPGAANALGLHRL